MTSLGDPVEDVARHTPDTDRFSRQFRAVVDNATFALFVLDERQGCAYMNPAAEALTGYTLAEVRGQRLHDFFHHTRPDGTPFPRVDCPIDNAYPTNNQVSGEDVFIHRDGHFFPAAYTASSLREGSDLVGTIVEMQEISARKEAEAALREQTEVVEAINHIGQMLTSELDLERLLQAVTDAATELTGAEFGSFFYNLVDERGESYTLYTLSGVPREAFSKFPMPRNTQIFAPTFRGEGIVRLDDVTKDPRYGKNPPYNGMPEGHLPVRSYLAVPVVARSGEVHGGLFFGHSRPGMFTARDERILAGIATQAGIAIDNAQLFAEAQQAIRLRDEFLSIASHELRNPVAAIKGAAQLLRRIQQRPNPNPERVQQYVAIIDLTAARLATMTDDLLDVSRLQRGVLPLRPQPTNLADLLRSVVPRMQAHSEQHRLTLAVQCDPCEVVVDPDRVEQIVENLLSNAIKYSPDGRQIEVALSTDGDGLLLSVCDQGIGLPANALERIFEPFGRAENAVERNIEGLGLGLYICRRIAEQHGGRLWAESPGDGQGTSMHLWLPGEGK
jgi:PAS domain S-box-containing protein